MALTLAIGSPAAAQTPPLLPVRALFANPAFEKPVLSPDGQALALIHNMGDVGVVIARPMSGTALTPIARIGDPEVRLDWLQWANDTRLLLSGESRKKNAIGVRARQTQLFGVNRDGSDFRWLGKRWPRYGNEERTVQFEDHITHWTPDDPSSVLVQIDPPIRGEWPRVMRMNVDSGALSPFQGPKASVRFWYADAKGDVRAAEGFPGGEEYVLWARISPDEAFAPVVRDVEGSGEAAFAGFHEDPAKLYVSKSHEGRNAVFEFDLRTKQLGPLVFSHPEVDVDSLLYSTRGEGRVIGFRFTTDSPQIRFRDAAEEREFAALERALTKEFGESVQVYPVSSSRDGNRSILHVSSDTQPPTYFAFDRSLKQLFLLIESRPGLERESLSPTKRVTYAARDGLSIPAFLTLPRGRPAENLPLVVVPHGGPWARDWIRWDPEVQLFASRGFAVLQMNFRGSTGYGDAFEEKGYREWGQKIQDDITDGARWAIAEGIADPSRIGIYGISYGGYSALMGAVKTPDLYRAAASYAGVSDIPTTLSDWDFYETILDTEERLIGGERGDDERLRQHSPLRRANEVRIPILLGHGTDDPTVHVHQSQRMARALREAGKDVTYLEFPDEIHGFVLEANRIRWYEALIAFFEKNLAPRAAGASAAAEPEPAAAP